jgi:hypothetical protein
MCIALFSRVFQPGECMTRRKIEESADEKCRAEAGPFCRTAGL